MNDWVKNALIVFLGRNIWVPFLFWHLCDTEWNKNLTFVIFFNLFHYFFPFNYTIATRRTKSRSKLNFHWSRIDDEKLKTKKNNEHQMLNGAEWMSHADIIKHQWSLIRTSIKQAIYVCLCLSQASNRHWKEIHWNPWPIAKVLLFIIIVSYCIYFKLIVFHKTQSSH